MTPREYTQNFGYDEEEGLIAGKFPFMNWASQTYNDWVSRNSLNLTGQFVIGSLQTIVGASTGNLEGAINGLSNTFGVMKQLYDHKLVPDSSKGNINGADINTAQDQNGFYFYKKSIKAEFARVIDGFFTKYGYKVNSLKSPNIFGRRYFNYVKTIEANVIAEDVPEKYLNEFKAMLNTGITFWHDTSHFMDYSVNNEIV